MSTIYIFSNFNNYYNRIVKKEDTISDYIDKYTVEYQLSGTNFVPNDGVDTTHVFGSSLHYYSGKGDYLIEVDENSEIVSRWFIIDSVRDRAGQWTLTLHRDVVVDYYEQVINADTYIEKATLNDNDSLIYNSEQLSVNQIKTSQTLLKDTSNSAWLVGYLAPNTESMSGSAKSSYRYDLTVDSIQNWEYYSSSGTKTVNANMKSAYIYMSLFEFAGAISYVPYFYRDVYTIPVHTVPRVTYQVDVDQGTTYPKNEVQYIFDNDPPRREEVRDQMFVNATNNSTTLSSLMNAMYGIVPQEQLVEIQNLNNKVIKDLSTNNYYLINVKIESGSVTENKTLVNTSYYSTEFERTLLGPASTKPSVDGNYFMDYAIFEDPTLASNAYKSFSASMTYDEVNITISSVDNTSYTYRIPDSTIIAHDSPYKIFCMPYRVDRDFTFKYNNATYTMSPQASLAVMMDIVKEKSGANVLYDAQILPYCPVEEFFEQDVFVLDDAGGQRLEDISFTTIKSGDNAAITGFIAFVSRANFDIVINQSIQIQNTKIDNECDRYRLCSPNFNGGFEFNAAKNGGVSSFIVSCTYKPYQPYIKIAPSFNKLYGSNFKDPRGLICGGDFGLPLVSDQWSTYEINNKNYLNSFNRQIENMEVHQDVARLQDMVGVVTGSLSGGASGAIIGSAGGPIGAAAGAVIGAGASIAGGIVDYNINERLRNEAIDYTKDQFNYSLKNIQALPYSLARVSSLTNDNTLYPILEYYTCTDREKTALANKIAFNGMTVMAVGKLKDYINNTWSYNGIQSKGYIKGKLIRIDNVSEDYHIMNTISAELNKGVYMR